MSNWVLCPTRPCDLGYYGFTRVWDTCDLYRWTSAATLDRPGAVIFTVFMSFWGEYNYSFPSITLLLFLVIIIALKNNIDRLIRDKKRTSSADNYRRGPR